jgi:MoaA/NifB/PqqE/SkfB family radical SAM enzyme
MSQQGVYSEDKMTWWWAREGKLPDAPKQVHWVLSDLCNQDCNFCSYRVSGNPSNELFTAGATVSAYGHDNPVRWVNTDRALRLVYEMQALGILAVQATGGGEPTAHPDHELIFQTILNTGIRLSLVSNGYRWRDKLFPLIPRMDWIRVSIDAGCAATYAAIRRVPESAFLKVLGNIEQAATIISKESSPCILGVGFTVTPDNWTDIINGARVAKEAGAQNLRLSAMFGPDNEKPFLPIYDRIKEVITEATERYQDAAFTIYDNFGSRLSDLVQHSPEYATCPYQYYVTYLGGNLHLFRCCVLSYSRRGMIAGADLTHQRFDDYWRSEARRADFAAFDARGCPRCMFNGKNRAVLYVMGNTASDMTPRHMEFV